MGFSIFQWMGSWTISITGRCKNPWTASTKPLWSMRAPSCCKPAVCGHNLLDKWSPSHSHSRHRGDIIGVPSAMDIQMMLLSIHAAIAYPTSCFTYLLSWYCYSGMCRFVSCFIPNLLFGLRVFTSGVALHTVSPCNQFILSWEKYKLKEI